MSKSTRNSGTRWSNSDIKQLKQLAKENTPTRVIGLKLGRTAAAVQSKASQEDISLKPSPSPPPPSIGNCAFPRPGCKRN